MFFVSTLIIALALQTASQSQAIPATDCDRLASNEWDPLKVSAAVTWEDMDVEKTIAACTKQISTHPNEIRFQYLLARALLKKHMKSKVALIKKVKPTLERAHKGGSAIASHTLGILYRDGNFGKNDYAKAKDYLEHAANEISLSAYSLGEMYNNKQLKEENNDAMRWYGLAADAGHTESQYIVAKFMYFSNNSEWKKRGSEYLIILANNGHIESLFLVGETLLSEGNSDGLQYLEKAANLGHVGAQLIVFDIYRTGKKVNKNPQLALKYLLLAVKGGRRDYINNLIALYMDEPSLGSEAARGKEMVKWAKIEGGWETLAFIGDMYFREEYGLYGESETRKWLNNAISLSPSNLSRSQKATLASIRGKIRFLDFPNFPAIRTVSDDELIRIYQQIKIHKGHRPKHKQSSLSTSLQFYTDTMEFWTKLDTLMGAKKLQSKNLYLTASADQKTRQLYFILSPRGGSNWCDAGLALEGQSFEIIDSEVEASDGTIETWLKTRTALSCKPITPVALHAACWATSENSNSKKDYQTKKIEFGKGREKVITNWSLEYTMSGDQALAYYDGKGGTSYSNCEVLD